MIYHRETQTLSASSRTRGSFRLIPFSDSQDFKVVCQSITGRLLYHPHFMMFSIYNKVQLVFLKYF